MCIYIKTQRKGPIAKCPDDGDIRREKRADLTCSIRPGVVPQSS